MFPSRSNKCFCNGAIPSCSHSDAIAIIVKAGIECCHIERNCSNFKELCNPAWLAPLHIPAMVTILHCEVADSGIGPYINSNRQNILIPLILLIVPVYQYQIAQGFYQQHVYPLVPEYYRNLAASSGILLVKCFSMVITDCQQGQSVMTLSCWQLVDNCKNSFVLHIMNTLF